RPRNRHHPLQVADAQQVLDVKERATFAQAGVAENLVSMPPRRAVAESMPRSPAAKLAAALLIRRRLPSSSSSRRTGPASARSSPAGASSPVLPCSTTSGTPRTAHETTG